MTSSDQATVDARVDSVAAELLDLSHALAAAPELAFEEVRSAAAVAGVLERHGFAVTPSVGGLDTAFDARFGSGSLTVAFVAEYDALPELGHACGHNIIAAAAVGAGLGLSAVADAHDVTVRVIGTPAEEIGGGKVLMLEAGVFDGVDAALMVHAGDRDIVAPRVMALADVQLEFAGDEAATARALADVRAAVAAWVTELAPLQRVFEIDVEPRLLDAERGPSVAVAYTIRATTLTVVRALQARLVELGGEAASAPGVSVRDVETGPAYAELTPDPTLTEAVAAQFARLGREATPEHQLGASTDMGNVTAALPGVHPILKVGDGSDGPHSPVFAQWCAGADGDRAVVDGAKLLAGAALTLAAGRTSPQI